MNEEYTIKPIAHIRTDFPEKFGVPRQSGIVENLISKIIFEPQYRDINALRGLEEYDYIWLIWQFSKNEENKWSATVRPPKLGGNKRMGVFASRSPFRPNGLGLSSVKIVKIDNSANEAPVIYVSGADMVDGTPIYDIKPYIPYSDCHTDAKGGFSKDGKQALVKVEFSAEAIASCDKDTICKIESVLSQDPHPSYKSDPVRIYKMCFSDYLVSFKTDSNRIYVLDINENPKLV